MGSTAARASHKSRWHNLTACTTTPNLPAAAVFLTNEQYTVKITDLWKSRGRRDYELDDIMLLKVGRHIRPRPHFKLIVGREEGENKFLEGYKNRYTAFRSTSHSGPLALLDGTADEADLHLSARLVARYGKERSPSGQHGGHPSRAISRAAFVVPPLCQEEIPGEWYIA